jgi:hypothetical protein
MIPMFSLIYEIDHLRHRALIRLLNNGQRVRESSFTRSQIQELGREATTFLNNGGTGSYYHPVLQITIGRDYLGTYIDQLRNLWYVLEPRFDSMTKNGVDLLSPPISSDTRPPRSDGGAPGIPTSGGGAYQGYGGAGSGYGM